jgi:hypothetical protein
VFSFTRAFLVIAAGAALLPAADVTTDLKPQTAADFDAYMRKAEARLSNAQGPFLWVDADPERKRQVQRGTVLAQPWNKQGDIEIHDGLVHDWVGAAFIPGVTLEQVLALVKDYDRHKYIYKPEVVDSKLRSHQGDDFKIYLRLIKKKVLTVTLNTEHDVHYSQIDAKRVRSQSYTTRIAEVDNAGQKDERELPPGKGHGFLWRLNSFWRFEERDGGVYIECEAISLTRDVPTGLGWLINPIIRNLPKDSLVNTLTATRQALTRK